MKASRLKLLSLLWALSAPLMAEECQHIYDCEKAFKESKQYLDLVNSGKKVVLIQSYRNNDTVVTDGVSYFKQVLAEGKPDAEVVIVTLSGWVDAGGWISDNHIYTHAEPAEQYRKKEEAERQRQAEIEKKRLADQENLRRFNEIKKKNDEERQRIKDEKLKVVNDKLMDLHKKLEKDLLFGLPLEDMMLFLIDGSGSVSTRVPGTDISYIQHTLNQLTILLPMLGPDQYFSVGFFNATRYYLFNNGKPVAATEKNVSDAISYLQESIKYLSLNSEDFNRALAQAFDQSHRTPHGRFDAIYVFSDMSFGVEDSNSSESLIAKEGSKFYLRRMGTTDEENARRFTRNGRILSGDINTNLPPQELARIRDEVRGLRQEIEKIKTEK